MAGSAPQQRTGGNAQREREDRVGDRRYTLQIEAVGEAFATDLIERAAPPGEQQRTRGEQRSSAQDERD